MELETLKIFIKSNLVNSFINSSKLPIYTPIFLIKKFNYSF